MNSPKLTLGQCVTLACLWEATAPKPGNVHRGADFEDMTFGEFTTSAAAIGPVFDTAGERSVGKLVLDAIQAMRSVVPCNTHLGTVLLLAPLAKAAAEDRDSVISLAGRITKETTVDDCHQAYKAIRLAAPGGLGDAPEADVRDAPDLPLIEAMRLAADRDLVARQYAGGFAEVERVSQDLLEASDQHTLSVAVVHAHVLQMTRCPDSLIARKCGPATARESADRASAVLDSGRPGAESYHRALAELDFWLRSDGHRRNPGTTADLVAASLFVLLVEGRLGWPVSF